jgi:KDO2-lipid IV(A) lauroyltransferase
MAARRNLTYVLVHGLAGMDQPSIARRNFQRIIAFLLGTVLGYRKRVIDQNLKHAFPEIGEKARKNLRQQNYAYLGRLVVETLRLKAASEQQMQATLRLEGHQVVSDLLQQGKKVILLTPHSGNWEWAGLGTAQFFCRQSPVWLIYKPLSSSFFERWYFTLRQRFGSEPVPMNQFARRFMKHSGSLLVLSVADQAPPQEGLIQADFFGNPTSFFGAWAKLASKSGAAIAFGHSVNDEEGWISKIEILAEDASAKSPEALVQLFAARLEDAIRYEPWNWLWSHKRWKREMTYQ